MLPPAPGDMVLLTDGRADLAREADFILPVAPKGGKLFPPPKAAGFQVWAPGIS